MPINIWTAGGKPSAYNPLPSGTGNTVIIKGSTNYVLTFKAKSKSGGILEVRDTTSGGSDFWENITLNDDLKEFKISFNSKIDQNIFFIDQANKGDIIVIDIQLVERAIPARRTQNLWTNPTSYGVLPSTAPFVMLPTGKDYTVSFMAKSPSSATIKLTSFNNRNDLYLDVPLTPEFKEYKISWTESDFGRFNIADKDNKGDISITDIKVVDKTTATRRSSSKVATLRPKKNYVPDKASSWEAGHINSTGANTAGVNNIRLVDKQPIIGGGNYIIGSANAKLNTIFYYYDKSGNFLSTPNVYWANGTTFTVPLAATHYRVSVRNSDLAPIKPADVESFNIQIEEGSVRTAFEPYSVGNKVANLVPKKNRIPGFTDSRWVLSTGYLEGDAYISPAGLNPVATIEIDVDPNTEYTYVVPSDIGRFIVDGVTTPGNLAAYTSGSASRTFNTGANRRIKISISKSSAVVAQKATFRNPQMEKGSTLGAYEPYQLVNKTSNR